MLGRIKALKFDIFKKDAFKKVVVSMNKKVRPKKQEKNKAGNVLNSEHLEHKQEGNKSKGTGCPC